MSKRHKRRIDADAAIDGEVVEVSEDPAAQSAPDPGEQRRARARSVQRASLVMQVRRRGPLYGSRGFFKRAAEQLSMSTRHGLELAGAVYARELAGRTILVGLQRRGSGKPGRVAISPAWGSILWHTHPGLRGSLAAFSSEDLEASRGADRPLLVIGYGGLSPEVLSTFTLPLGLRGLLLASGVKGIMSLEKAGHLKERLLRLGVAARVCYPDGTVQPVLRLKAAPMMHAFEDMSFAIDRSVGAMERAGQRALRKVIERVTRA